MSRSFFLGSLEITIPRTSARCRYFLGQHRAELCSRVTCLIAQEARLRNIKKEHTNGIVDTSCRLHRGVDPRNLAGARYDSEAHCLGSPSVTRRWGVIQDLSVRVSKHPLSSGK